MLDREQLAKDNINLIYAFMQKYHLIEEDWFGAMSVAYMKAVQSYNPDGGAAFSTYAYQAMYYDLVHTFSQREDNRMAKQLNLDPKECRLISLNVRVLDSDDSPELQDIVSDPIDCYDDILTNDCYKRFYSKLDERDRRIVDFRLDGLNYREIGRKLGISHERVRQRLEKIREVFDQSFSSSNNTY